MTTSAIVFGGRLFFSYIENRSRITSEAVFISQARHMQTHESSAGSRRGHIKTTL